MMGYSQKETESTARDYTQFVNPMIGTSKMGYTFPGGTTPFGMVQLSPQTNFQLIFKDDGSYNAKPMKIAQAIDTIIPL